VTVERVDHVAVEVGDLDARLAFLTGHLGMRVQREGRLTSDPSRRIAMVGDGHGFKLELVEAADRAAPDRLVHVAWRVDDVDRAHGELRAAGCAPITEPRRLDAAGSRTATVQPTTGVPIQLVAYDDDSPDR
jgi:methylmalonyl-CoA/ethylmalonyl-CoA epimerase